MEGYIKLSRKLLAWEWYGDSNTLKLFIHCLLMANWKDGKYKGVDVPRGSFVSSLRTLAKELNMTERMVRTSLAHLKSTQEVTQSTYPKFSVFTVVSYDKYQSSDTQSDRQATHKRHAIEEEKKESNNNIIYNAHFDALWQAYPRKRDKARAYKCYLARLKDGFSEDELYQAVKRYAEECRTEHREERYIKHAATFLGPNTPFMDYLRPEVKSSGDDLLDQIANLAGKRKREVLNDI